MANRQKNVRNTFRRPSVYRRKRKVVLYVCLKCGNEEKELETFRTIHVCWYCNVKGEGFLEMEKRQIKKEGEDK